MNDFYCARIILNGLKHADTKMCEVVGNKRGVPCRQALWSLYEQYVKSLGLSASPAYWLRDLTSCFARTLMHCDNKPLQKRS